MKINIGNKGNPSHKISPYIFGNFVECGFGRQTNGMWAEKIYNRSFQPITPYKDITWHWLGLNPEDYNSKAPFWHSGYEEENWRPINDFDGCTEYTAGTESYKGHSSFMVINKEEGREQGLSQKRIFVKRDEPCDFQIFGGFITDFALRVIPPLEGVTESNQISYENKDMHIEFIDEKTQNVLLREDCKLKPIQTLFTFPVDFKNFEGYVTIRIVFEFSGTLVLSWSSMMPRNNRNGWRSDMVELMKDIEIPVIRYPGGCYTSFFNWREWAVPRTERRALPSFFWGGLDENDTGIDEFLDLCHMTGSEPQICINMMTSNAFEAAQLVEYCNGDEKTSMAKLRKFNKVKREKKVRFWEMDNEAARKWAPLQYAEKVVEFSREMRKVDPSIFIMMEYYTYGFDNLTAMLQVAGEYIDAVIHRSTELSLIENSNKVISEYNKQHRTSIVFVNTEWLSEVKWPEPFDDKEVPHDFEMGSYGRSDYKKALNYRQISWFYALNTASILLDFIALEDKIYLANFNNCVNTWGQNVIESSKEKAWLSLVGEVFKVFREAKNAICLNCKYDAESALKIQACLTTDGKTIAYVLNKTKNKETISFTMEHKSVLQTSLHMDDLLGKKDGLTIKENSLSSNDTIEISPYSITKFVFKKDEKKIR